MDSRTGPLVTIVLVAVISLLAIATLSAAERDVRLVDAVKAGDKAAASLLLRQRIDVNAAEPDGTTALHWAVRQDDLQLTAELVAAGADVKAANRYGVTALYLASVNGSAAMIEKLLKAGANANAAAPEGETALMTAARTGNVEAARVLLAHGARVEAREGWRGQTALMWAAAQNHPAMVLELLSSGADVNARSAVQQWERQNTQEPREKWLAPGGLTPLLFAARQGSLDSARILVEAGADVNATDPAGISAVLSAIINGHYDVAGFLLEKGIDPNLADTDGRTALFAAVDMNTMPVSNIPMPKVIDNRLTSLDLIGMLLARGANVNAQLTSQQAYRAKLDRGTDTVLTTGTTPLLRAAKAGDAAAVRLLLEKGADPKLATKAGVNPLMIAAGLGTKEEDTTGRNKTESDAIKTITLLLDAGPDIDVINAADNTGRTALHGAALQGYDQVVRFLADRGAKLDVKDQRGFTPLDVAMGLAGGVGFDGKASNPHESTAALLRGLIGGTSVR
jgi:ankyrin repeat protein